MFLFCAQLLSMHIIKATNNLIALSLAQWSAISSVMWSLLTSKHIPITFIIKKYVNYVYGLRPSLTCWHDPRGAAHKCVLLYTALMRAFDFICVGDQGSTSTFDPLSCYLRASPAPCTCEECVKENISRSWTAFTWKYVLAAWRMHIWGPRGLFLSRNVIRVSCQLDELVKWGRAWERGAAC